LPKFIVFEGLDGSGTSTQSALLKKALGDSCFLDQEPSDGYIGKMLREILEQKKKVNPITLLQLFLADRVDHQNILKEKLSQGQNVIFTRYIVSTLAYQGIHFDTGDLYEFNKNFKVPDYTFFLEVDPKTSLKRKDGGKDLFENFETLNKVTENYKKAIDLLKTKGWKIFILNGLNTPEAVHSQIKEILKKEGLLC